MRWKQSENPCPKYRSAPVPDGLSAIRSNPRTQSPVGANFGVACHPPTMAVLKHPNIAKIRGLKNSDTTRALVMELIEGPTIG